MEILTNVYIQSAIVVLIIVGITVFTKVALPKLKIWLATRNIILTKEDLIFMEQVFSTVDYVAEKLGYEISDDLQSIVEYAYDAYNFIIEIENVTDKTALLEIMIDKTKETMMNEDIRIDPTVELIIIEVVKFIVANTETK